MRRAQGLERSIRGGIRSDAVKQTAMGVEVCGTKSKQRRWGVSNTTVTGWTTCMGTYGNGWRIAGTHHTVVHPRTKLLGRTVRTANAYCVAVLGTVLRGIFEPPIATGSLSTAANDVGAKRELYASLGVREYWRFDPTGGEHYGEPLAGEYMAASEYRRFEMRRDPGGEVRGHSPLLDLDFIWLEGRLRFYDTASGRWLENHAETAARANTAEARAYAEQTARESERAAREYAEARLADVEAELRRLRGEQV